MRLVVSFGFITLCGSSLLASCVTPDGASGGSEPIGEAAEAAIYCQCTDYVYYRFSLSNPAYPNAKDWGPYLTNMGYVQSSTPVVGYIVVYQPGHTGVNPTDGHVGVIASVSPSSLGVRAANQGGTQTEYNCNDVNTVSYSRQSAYEAYYYMPAPSGPWCSSNCAGGGWWCWNDGGCITNGVSGHNYHCPGNNVAPDVDQACANGCVTAAAGYPDYCQPTYFCSSGAWCGNDCVGGYAQTLYNFSSTGAVTSVTQCQIGHANHTCVTAPAGTADYCN